MSKPHPPENVRELLDYDPQTGFFTWKYKRERAKIGDLAGTLRRGYVIITFDGWKYFAHRLAWLFTHGEMPSRSLDHINGIRNDNRIANLRLATYAENSQNTRLPRKKNKSGLLGVVPNRLRWAAQITLNGKTRHLGTFNSPEEAHAVYLAAKADLHPFFVPAQYTLDYLAGKFARELDAACQPLRVTT